MLLEVEIATWFISQCPKAIPRFFPMVPARWWLGLGDCPPGSWVIMWHARFAELRPFWFPFTTLVVILMEPPVDMENIP